MREQRDNSAKLFLTELMLAIFFFSLVTAFCVQLFVEAHAMSTESEKLTKAVNTAANAAECYSSWDFQKESWQSIFPQGSWEQDKWQLSYDENWCPCTDQGSYLLQMQLTQKDSLCEAHISVQDAQGRELYVLDAKRVCGQ